jgi:hypothetical protein
MVSSAGLSVSRCMGCVHISHIMRHMTDWRHRQDHLKETEMAVDELLREFDKVFPPEERKMEASANWGGPDLPRNCHGWPDVQPSGRPDFIWPNIARRRQVSNLGIGSAPPVRSSGKISSTYTSVWPDILTGPDELD